MTLGTETKISMVPNFLKAPSPELLREEMFFNNVRMKSEVKYFDIQQDKSGFWFAWFYEEIDPFSKIKPKKVK